jgi:glutamate synthase (NADPH/NADH) large chain
LALLHAQQPDLYPDIHFRMRGTAGQSFGAFAGRGMKLVLEGQANDFVGKGLSGGELVIRTRGKLARAESAQVIVGNVALYGATGGSLFAVGSAGERFAIRNSGATAVVEGVGDHACEYMTGGAVLVLGPTGTNFGAGMTGGLAFVWDPSGSFVKDQKFHPEFVAVEILGACEERDQELVRCLLEEHSIKTGSKVANRLHHGWPVTLRQIVRVAPKSV